MNFLFITFENNEWCQFVVRIGSPAFTSFYCAFRFFLYLPFFLIFFLWILLLFGFEVNLSILKTKQWSCPRFLSGVSRGELLQPFLVINLPGLVQFGKNLSYILPPLAS